MDKVIKTGDFVSIIELIWEEVWLCVTLGTLVEGSMYSGDWCRIGKIYA